MNSIFILLKNLKNLIPYFLLIAIYFFFVNLEARNENDRVRKAQKEKILAKEQSSIDDRDLRIKIPVIPHGQ